MSMNAGTHPMLQRRWAPKTVISGLEAPAEKYILDPELPILGHDPSFFTNDDTVIPRGRFLSVKNSQTASIASYANTNRPILTLSNGTEGLVDGNGISLDLKPLGFSEQQFFQEKVQGAQQIQPQITKHKLIQVPYIQASNGAYGSLKPGDKVTAFYGTAGSGAPIPNEVGKPVKWVARRIFTTHQAASATVQLTSAIYPAFKPNVVLGLNAGTGVAITSATYSYVGSNWQVVLNASVTDVVYEYGQFADNIAGTVSSFEAVGTAGGQLTSPHEWEGWLQWVTDDWGQFPFPPLFSPRPYTSTTNEVPSQIDAFTYRIAHFPVVPTLPITVTVTGTIIDPITGISTTLTGAQMPLNTNTFFTDYTYGASYELNPVTGVLTFTTNVTVTAVTVSYSYENSYADGRMFDAGQMGLTDGQYSGQRGTPANLELLGVIAAMRIMAH